MLFIRQESKECWQQCRAALQGQTKSDSMQCTLVRKMIAKKVNAA